MTPGVPSSFTGSSPLLITPTSGSEGTFYRPGSSGNILSGDSTAIFTVVTTNPSTGGKVVTLAVTKGSRYAVSGGNPTDPTVGSGDLKIDIASLCFGGKDYLPEDTGLIDSGNGGASYAVLSVTDYGRPLTGIPYSPGNDHPVSGFPLSFGRPVTAIPAPGLGGVFYQPGDTFSVSGGDGSAVGTVLTVGASNQVLTFSVTGGVGYSLGLANTSTLTTRPIVGNPVVGHIGNLYAIGDTFQILGGDDAAVGTVLSTFVYNSSVQSISISGGSGYPPNTPLSTITLTGGGSGLEVTCIGANGLEIEITSLGGGGHGYNPGDTFQILGGDGAAVGTVLTVDSANQVLTFSITGGTGYAVGLANTVTLTGSGTGLQVEIFSVGGGGIFFQPGDTALILAGDAAAILTVLTVGPANQVLTFSIAGGSQYVLGTNIPTLTLSGQGGGLQVDITALAPGGAVLNIEGFGGAGYVVSTGNPTSVLTGHGDGTMLVDILTVTQHVTTPTLTLTCGSPPSGAVFEPYTHAFPATGGTPPYTFVIVSGSLPPGLVLNPSTGTIAGMPTEYGTFSFGIQVNDGIGELEGVTCSISIFAPAARLTLVCDLRTGAWSQDSYANSIISRCALVQPEGTLETSPETYPLMVMADDKGNVYAPSLTAGDNGQPITALVGTFEWDGQPLRNSGLWESWYLDCVPIYGLTVNSTMFGQVQAPNIPTTSIGATSSRVLVECPVPDGSLNRFLGLQIEWTDQPGAPFTILHSFRNFADPDSVFSWKTSKQTFGLHGYLFCGRLEMTYSCTEAVTMNLTAFDGTSSATMTMPATGGQTQKILITPTVNKGQLLSFSAASAAPFQIMGKDSLLWLRSWGSTGPWILYPLGAEESVKS